MAGTLDDFVRARVEEEVLRARGGLARRTTDGGEDWVEALTGALDKRELLALATTADLDARGDYAEQIRRSLAAHYRSHPDYRADFRA